MTDRAFFRWCIIGLASGALMVSLGSWDNRPLVVCGVAEWALSAIGLGYLVWMRHVTQTQEPCGGGEVATVDPCGLRDEPAAAGTTPPEATGGS